MSDTDTPTGPGPAPFGVRLDAATLARLDAYAERIDKKRGGAAARVIAAGLDALEGLPVRAPFPSQEATPPPAAALDVDALARALAEHMGPMLAAAVADGLRRPPRESPPPAPPADGPRIDPATLRGVGGERRRNPPERRDPPPREDLPGRRLADALRAARDARGLTQRDAAAAARVPLATYQRAEQGNDVRESTRAALTAWIGEG